MREVAKHADKPVINMQCDVDHPTQTLADLMTIREKLGVIKTYPWVFIGCGFLTTTLSVLVPFVALPIVIPCSVVGFTLTLIWLQHEDVPLPEDRRLAETLGRVEVF